LRRPNGKSAPRSASGYPGKPFLPITSMTVKALSAAGMPLKSGDPVRVTFQLFDYDAKRMHYFEQLFHAEERWLSATSENMVLHVDLNARKTAAFGDAVAARLARMKAAHAHLPVPDGAGRGIAMRAKPLTGGMHTGRGFPS
jgi:hypothetical protein